MWRHVPLALSYVASTAAQAIEGGETVLSALGKCRDRLYEKSQRFMKIVRDDQTRLQ